MASPRVAPYGSWKSPISAERIVGGTVLLSQPGFRDEEIFWSESRPWEGGRSVLVRWSPDGATEDVTPPPFSARTRVNEYGGGAYLAAAQAIYFWNDADRRLYEAGRGKAPR
ncbi:MAG: S9 family peptidase, partial [Candidatus Latescibacteria bacterium]|nr:S9 family peptidase [Candidatus Latescibacterota bacterium]